MFKISTFAFYFFWLHTFYRLCSKPPNCHPAEHKPIKRIHFVYKCLENLQNNSFPCRAADLRIYNMSTWAHCSRHVVQLSATRAIQNKFYPWLWFAFFHEIHLIREYCGVRLCHLFHEFGLSKFISSYKMRPLHNINVMLKETSRKTMESQSMDLLHLLEFQFLCVHCDMKLSEISLCCFRVVMWEQSNCNYIVTPGYYGVCNSVILRWF